MPEFGLLLFILTKFADKIRILKYHETFLLWLLVYHTFSIYEYIFQLDFLLWSPTNLNLQPLPPLQREEKSLGQSILYLSMESPHQGRTFDPNQNFQKSIFKPSTAIAFTEEMRTSVRKFSTFFSMFFFWFLILKMSFIG